VIGESIDLPARAAASGVRLWRIDLDAYAPRADFAELQPSERRRAARMLEQVGTRWMASRHALRTLLSDALNRPAATLAIDTDVFGRPCVAGSEHVHFSVSHSANVCVIGLAPRPLGVDVEVLCRVRDAQDLARRHFTPAEIRDWRDDPSDARFLRCWTRKEACLKALGVGLLVSAAHVDAGCASRARKVTVALGSASATIDVESLDAGADCLSAVGLTTLEDVVLARKHANAQ